MSDWGYEGSSKFEVFQAWSFPAAESSNTVSVLRRQTTDEELAGENNPALGDSNDLIDLLVNCPALGILMLDFCLPSQLTWFPRGRFPIVSWRVNFSRYEFIEDAQVSILNNV